MWTVSASRGAAGGLSKALARGGGPSPPLARWTGWRPAAARASSSSSSSSAATTTTTAAAPVERWSYPTRLMHATLAVSVIGGIGAALQAQEQPKTPEGEAKRADLMFWHKSFGVLTICVLPLRWIVRVFETAPKPLPAPAWMQLASRSTHVGLHLFLAAMAGTGYVMAEYSGRPLPFFFTTIPPESLGRDPELAKQAYWWHTRVGKYGKVLVPLHVAGAGAHLVMGQRILARMNPFVF